MSDKESEDGREKGEGEEEEEEEEPLKYAPAISALPPKVIQQEESQVEVSASPAFQCLEEVCKSHDFFFASCISMNDKLFLFINLFKINAMPWCELKHYFMFIIYSRCTIEWNDFKKNNKTCCFVFIDKLL